MDSNNRNKRAWPFESVYKQGQPIRRPHYQPVFSRVVRAPEETLSAIDEHDRVIVDEPTPQQYDLIYDAPEVIIPTSHRSNSNYARFSHGFFPWASIRPRTRLSDMTNVKLAGPKRGTSGIRLI
eukprot:TCALIF_03879-PA protein Name:"Protein of unknown function" AED:0.36 eAED:0.36 QI:0/0.5/0.66/0.66/0.5/0.33/3/488/123